MLTEQEKFWQEEFGDEYTERNKGDSIIAGNIALFAKILARTGRVRSVLEFGAGSGNNLKAIKAIMPGVSLSAVEINKKAAQELWSIAYVFGTRSILEWDIERPVADLTLSKGLLIHIEPSMLPVAYDALYGASMDYICLVEYYNPTPVEVPYRGHKGKLFKRDFAGDMLDRYDNLKLVDYGFVYHRDKFKQDDVHWWVLQK